MDEDADEGEDGVAGVGAAALRRAREVALGRGSLLLGVGCAGVPLALVDVSFGVSDRLIVALTDGAAPTIDPRALAAIAWFLLIGVGAVWRARVDPWARRWLGPISHTFLILAIWRLGGSPAALAAFSLGVIGVIYLRDVEVHGAALRGVRTRGSC